MDTNTPYRSIIERMIREYAAIPYAYSEIERQAVFDRENDHYLSPEVRQYTEFAVT